MAYKFFVNPFAVDGDKTIVPDATQPSGSVSYEQGWTFDYQIPIGSDPAAKAMPRDQSNQLLYDVTLALQQYQIYGIPEFITTVQNLGSPFPYPKYAMALYDPGSGLQPYQSLVDNNTALPTDITKWAPLSISAIPVSTVIYLAGTIAPTGYLACDGSAVSRTTYAALFDAIGTTWGAGDGSTTFNLPSAPGRTPIGSGTGSGLTPRTLGQTGGAETVTLDISEVPAHSHAPSAAAAQFLIEQTGLGTLDILTGGTRFLQDAVTDTQGGGGSHNNMQPFLVLNPFIKY